MSDRIRVERHGTMRLYLEEGVEAHKVLEAIQSPGEILKSSPKATTRRVGEWVVKMTQGNSLWTRIKMTFAPGHYRRAWRSSRHLFRHGLLAPEPFAYVEWSRAGLRHRCALLTRYLDGYVNVEEYARRLMARSAGEEGSRAFLGALAYAVNALAACGAYHGDLSGKNIFTRDGASFVFIDLDGVYVGQAYTDTLRMRNHVQLYDSFCDLWGPDILDPFIGAMLPEGSARPAWIEQVHAGQAARRARIERVWAKEGRQPGSSG